MGAGGRDLGGGWSPAGSDRGVLCLGERTPPPPPVPVFSQPPWDPAPNSIIFTSFCPRLLEVGLEVRHGCPTVHRSLPPTPTTGYMQGGSFRKALARGERKGLGESVLTPRSLTGNWGFPGGSWGFFSCKEPACQSRRCKRLSLIPGLGRSPGGGHGNPL